MWTEIARVNSRDELLNFVPEFQDVPIGTQVKIRLELQPWAPIGRLADLAGAEFWVPQLAKADIDVTDVYGDWQWIEIVGVTRGTPVILIAAGLAVGIALLGLGVYLASVIISANMEKRKLEQANEWLSQGYTPEQVTALLKSTSFSPASGLPAALGISSGTILLVGAVLAGLFLLKK